MKKIFLFSTLLLISLAMAHTGYACVGRILTIGALSSTNEQLLAEMLATLINERTGTTVNIKYFENQSELYSAVKNGTVSILIENTERAAALLGKTKPADNKEAYALVREGYKKSLDLVLLDAFGVTPDEGGKGQLYYVPIITTEVLTDYPALPRVINKLGGVTDEKSYLKLFEAVKSGDKVKRVAKDYLKQRRLI
ncbi:MAG: hypothetical protein A2511_15120 [Deltaproteobacteria bacterium RIFOXYD12_FULL_50_9]|nr:MAG: hypothetical protein A2511_15120 [Deltaproteobacteria bacterium RIFOXYD12_FULL_50_9]